MARSLFLLVAIIATTVVVVHAAREVATPVNRWAQVDQQYSKRHDEERSVHLVSPPSLLGAGLSTLSLASMGLPQTNFLHTNQQNADQGEWIITVKGPISSLYHDAISTAVAATGGHLSSYLPHDSFLVAGPSHSNDAFAAALSQLDGVRSVQPFTAVSKISPSLTMREAHAQFVAATVEPAVPTTDAEAAQVIVHQLRVHVSAHGPVTAAMVAEWRAGMLADNVITSTDIVKHLNERYVDISVSGSYVPTVMWLAARHDVHFIESRNTPFVIQNKFAQSIVQDNSKYDNVTSSMWLHGLNGEGQIVGLGDTGIDYDSCFFHDPAYPVPVGKLPRDINLKHRKIVMYVPIGDAGDQALGHGTHVAGSIAGEVLTTKTDAYAALHPYNGVAYKSKLAFWDFTAGAGLLVPDDLYNDYYLPTQQRTGAGLISSSWGSQDGQYSSFCLDTDRYVNEHQDFLPIYAAGNYGEKGLFTVSAPGVAKNVLTVGASLSSSASFFALGQSVGFQVVSPSTARGTYQVVPAGFGPAYYQVNIPTGSRLIIANPSDACNDLINASEMQGAVVLVLRGTCKFYQKAQRVQAAGAKLMLVANNEPGPAIPMGNDGATVFTMYAGMITQQDWLFINASATAAKETIHINAPVGFDSPDLNENNMASFSSRGPTYDGRIKPDIVAPGMFVKSSRSDGNIQSLQCDATDLLPMQGTSMATPVTAGAVALIRQYYMDGFYPSGIATKSQSLTPSAALLKATIIATGTSIGGEVRTTYPSISFTQIEAAPSKYQGFGRALLSRALAFADTMECDRPSLFVADYVPIKTGEVKTYCFTAKPVMNHPYPLRATLVWSDPAADASATFQLVNNLDLFVVNNDTQQVVFGNAQSFIDIDGVHWPADDTNNVEQVTVNTTSVTRPTLFTVHVRGTNVPSKFAQNFSLVVNGFFTQLPLEQCDSAVLCPNSCSNQGTCQRTTGLCMCNSGHAGSDCSQVVVALVRSTNAGNETLRTVAPVLVPVGAWEFFEYTIENWMINTTTAGHRITMLRTSGSGDPDLYVTVNSDFPSFANWQYQSTSCDSCPPPNNKPSFVDIPYTKLTIGTVVRVGVYGYCCESSSVALLVTRSFPTPVPDVDKPTPRGIVALAAILITLAIFALGFVVVWYRRRRAATSSQGYVHPGAAGAINGGASSGNGGFMPLNV